MPFLRSCSLKRPRGAKLRPSFLAAPESNRLPLLPSGPDGVHDLSPRKTQPSTPLPRSSLQGTQTSWKAVNPAIADCGFRAPLIPRLAQPHDSCYAMYSHSVKESCFGAQRVIEEITSLQALPRSGCRYALDQKGNLSGSISSS